MAIALLAGFTVGLSPNASAHLDTGSVAVVTGEVEWPEEDHDFFELDRGLNGCRLDADHPSHDPPSRVVDGNSAAGLPLGTLGGPKDEPPELSIPPTEEELNDLADWLESGADNPPRLYNNTDLCFRFVDVEILTAGVWENRAHATSFACEASGTSGATGAASLTDGDPGAILPTFGAFFGKFECDGGPAPGAPGFVPTADGHFHGLTVAGTTIAFLGTVQCTEPPFDPNDPLNPDNCPRTVAGEDKSQGEPPKPVNVSAIKHTLACKGEVLPVPLPNEPKNPSLLDTLVEDVIQNSIGTATVVLECVIA